MEKITSLRHHLLVAMPSVREGCFAHAVIYVCEHQPQGTLGLMINRPLVTPLSFVFKQLNLEVKNPQQVERPLLFGGPMQMERGFVIHRPYGRWHSSLLLEDEVTVTTSNDIIRAFADNSGPQDALVTLGFVGWDSARLEKEMLANTWLVCPYRAELLYDVPFEQRWEQAGLSIGVTMSHLVEGMGHA